MSLQVWLPLVRDYSNQGLCNAIPALTSSNSSIVASGKLGNCLHLNDVGEINTNCNINANTTSLSFGGWYKFNKAEIQAVIDTKTYSSTNKTSVGNLIGNNSYGGVGLIFTTNDLYSNNKILTTFSVFANLRATGVNKSTSSKSLDFDIWYHIFTVIDKDNLVLSLYVDGQLFNSVTLSEYTDVSTRNLFLNYKHVASGNGVVISPPCYANDIRIYDHALSAKEIKELSNGLVCHYTLGDRGVQQLNNCYSYPTFNTSSAGGGWNHWGGSGHIGTYGQNTDTTYIFRSGQPYSHWVANGSGATYNYLVYQSPAFEGGTRSLCCIIKHENSLPITNSICYPTWNARSGGTPINAWTSIISLSNGFYLCKCENIQQDGSNDLVGVYVTAGNKIYISEGYLENDRVCCSDIFYNDTTVYDSSGYNYHGTSSGISVSSDTPKYSVSTVFDANADTITPTACFSVGQTMTQLSVSIWFKTDTLNSTTPNIWSLGENLFARIRLEDATHIWNYFRVGTTQVSFSYSAGKTLTDNTWHHVVFTFKDGIICVYLDGIKIAESVYTSTATYMTCSSTDWHLAGYRANSENFIGSLSDFRIYSTCLSADDILELYHTGASIDKSGNMYAYEFNEV